MVVAGSVVAGQVGCATSDRAALLAAAGSAQEAVAAAETAKLVAAVRWLSAHTLTPAHEHEAATLDPGVEVFLPLGGEGAPLVAESAVVDFGPALNLHPRAARSYLADALELGWRLPNVYARAAAGDLPAWRARRVAALTRDLDLRVATVVDERIAPFVHGLGPIQIEHFVAATRQEVDRIGLLTDLETRVDRPHVAIDRRQVGYAGTLRLSGMLDLADAHDLDDALAHIAAHPSLAGLADVGDHDARRARALGELARAALGQDTLGLFSLTGDGAGDVGAPRPRRRTTLYLHLAEAAIGGPSEISAETGRVENTGAPVTADQVAGWCGRADTDLTVTPVRDLADHVGGGAYERSTRVAELVALRDPSCVFPWCTRPARALAPGDHAADCDHVHPHGSGGATCSCNLAPLCRTHHRAKTHGRDGRPPWRYRPLRPGLYLWTAPHGRRYLRDATGTYSVDDPAHDPP